MIAGDVPSIPSDPEYELPSDPYDPPSSVSSRFETLTSSPGPAGGAPPSSASALLALSSSLDAPFSTDGPPSAAPPHASDMAGGHPSSFPPSCWARGLDDFDLPGGAAAAAAAPPPPSASIRFLADSIAATFARDGSFRTELPASSPSSSPILSIWLGVGPFLPRLSPDLLRLGAGAACPGPASAASFDADLLAPGALLPLYLAPSLWIR
mmetsp:Transcript_12465/g.29423  ORF Transcript_12465/g.29423 Transcript_12465/m.29423 type:complete len:210 (-) Transcript_12465:535-1164(-)